MCACMGSCMSLTWGLIRVFPGRLLKSLVCGILQQPLSSRILGSISLSTHNQEFPPSTGMSRKAGPSSKHPCFLLPLHILLGSQPHALEWLGLKVLRMQTQRRNLMIQNGNRTHKRIYIDEVLSCIIWAVLKTWKRPFTRVGWGSDRRSRAISPPPRLGPQQLRRSLNKMLF